jgi:hypothetical protein
MGLPTLDTRSAPDVRLEAQKLAQHYLGGVWKGAADPGDPAAHLLDLFSRMMELLIFRLNRAPEKNFLAFLDLVGIERSPGAPAVVPLTFVPNSKLPEGGPIPAGTKVATTQTDQIDAQIFQTRAAIHATGAKLVAGVQLIPSRDAFSLLPTGALSPLPGASTEVESLLIPAEASGLSDVPHQLYLGGQALFGRKEKLDVTLVFTLTPGSGSFPEAGSLEFTRFDKDSKQWIKVPFDRSILAGAVQIRLRSFENNQKTAVLGQEDFWVRCEFTSAFDALSPLAGIQNIEGFLALPAAPENPPPDKVFANGSAVDLSKPFRPFGARPRYGDALYVSSDRAFSPDVKDVTVEIKLKTYSAAELSTAAAVRTLVDWEYLTADGRWKLIPNPTPASFEHTLTGSGPTHVVTRDSATTTSEDGTFFGVGGAPTATFTFARPPDLGKGKINGEEGYWIRALLKNDDPFGKEAFVTEAGGAVTVHAATLIPPVVESLTLGVTYLGQPRTVARVVSVNNLRAVDHGAGGQGPTYPLSPFIDPRLAALPDAAPLAFAADSALYLGFDQPFGDVYISLYVRLRETFPSVLTPAEKGDPRMVWEYLAAPGWKPLDVTDGTASLTNSGIVSFVGPSDATRSLLFDPGALVPKPEAYASGLYWYRIRLAAGHFDHPPRLLGIHLNTVLADNRFSVEERAIIGSGNGEKGQLVTLLKTPVLGGELWVREAERPPAEEIRTLFDEQRLDAGAYENAPPADSDPIDRESNAATGGVFVRWRRVPNFLSSGPRSRHYTLEPVTGELRFGNGELGMLPLLAKDNLVFRDYRSGGGEQAVRAAVPFAVKELKSSLPYVDKVFNVESATGGADPWTREQIFEFGPQVLKNKKRAVSAEDFEWMVREHFSEIARVKCVATHAPGANGLVLKPGAVTVVVVPKGAEPMPRPSSALLSRVRDFLVEHCFGTIVSDVYAVGPAFTDVAVQASVRAVNARESGDVERRAVKALEDFFHPLRGGEAGSGWEFGRNVQLSEVFAVLQRVPGVDYVQSAEFIGAPPGALELDISRVDGVRREAALVASGAHRIEMS